jgi:copper resistance protein B
MKPAMLFVLCVLAISAVSVLAREHAVHQAMPDDAAAHIAPDGNEPANAGIPPITDAERAAAFPDLPGHAVHDHAIRYMVLADQLEWRDADAGSTVSWDLKGWVGQDEERLWFRAEGERADSRTEDSEIHLLWGRRVARWWDVVAGARQNFKPGPSQTCNHSSS